LYDEQGFPLDLTELMARERGLTVDVAGFEKLMEQQRERGRKAQKKGGNQYRRRRATSCTDEISGIRFFGNRIGCGKRMLRGKKPDELNIVLDRTPCYAEMGGQVGDRGLLHVPGHELDGGWSVAHNRHAKAR